MMLPDVNLLVYAVDETSPFHAPARRWWDDTLSSTAEVGRCCPSILGFIRLTTLADASAAGLPGSPWPSVPCRRTRQSTGSAKTCRTEPEPGGRCMVSGNASRAFLHEMLQPGPDGTATYWRPSTA